MKKNIFYIGIFVTAFIVGCENTNENWVQDRGSAVVPTMSDAKPAYFTDNIEASYVSFDLSLPAGETIDKAQIEVQRGNKSVILRDVTLPATGVKVTAGEVLAALNIPVSDYNLGDVFNLYVLTTKNGRTTRSVASFSIPVICYFAPSMLVGAFDFESTDWEVAGSVTMEADPDDPYKIYINGYPEAEGLTTGNGNRIVLNVNPNNFSVKGEKVILADDLSEWGLPYHNYSYEAIAGTYSACDEAYTITFAITVTEGSFGNNVFVFKRTP
jgi:hypothetical protein